jgi:hypothetical protein
MHNIPLTPLEKDGLEKHRLPVGTPSQTADAFRQGIAWAIRNYQPTAVPEEWREVLSGLVAIAEKKGKKQGSPNHFHKRPGIWDDDNGPVLSGNPCAECAMYDKARAMLQSAPQPTHSGDATDMVKNADSSAIQHHPV